MRKCKIDDYARNGVRVSQYSKFILLGALAFLCLAIVSLCVFSNLNALAMENIAFADGDEKELVEEPTRAINSTGEIEWNYLPDNYILDRVISETITDQSYYVLCSDDYLELRVSSDGDLTIINNMFVGSNNLYFTVYIKDYTHFSNMVGTGSYCSLILYKASTGSGTFGSYNIEFYNSNGVWTNFASCSYNVTTAWLRGAVNYIPSQNGNYCRIKCSTSGNIQLRAVGLYRANANIAYVPKSYLNYGYDQGYQDGLNAGGGSSDPIFPIDTGFVGTNLMPNSYCLGYTYDSHINTTSDRYYSDSDWIYTYGYGTGQYSLVNNVLTNVNANYVSLKYEGFLPSGDYIFTLGFTSSYSYDVEVDIYNSNTFDDYGEHVEKFENEAPYWISSAFTIPNSNMRSSGTPVTIDVICFLDNNTSINLNFIKLETGSVFTGYAIDDNGTYQDGYDDGLAEGYTTGYDDGVTQATIDFDYIVWSSTVNTSSGLVANIDQPEFNPNTYDNSAVFIRVYSVDNQAHTYVDPVTCSFYITFDNTLSTGFVIYIDFNFNVDFTGSQKIGYTFAPLDTGYNSDEAWGFRDGVFDNNTSGIMLIVPRTSNRLYFSFGVTETKGVSGAGGLPLYYLYSFSVSGDNKILANSVGANSDIVEDAYNRGKEDGFLLGQIDGQNNNPYSFKSLFSSIYDVPVGAFNNMFNFDVFGVNFRTFLLAMISLALGLFIWKVIVRGG